MLTRAGTAAEDETREQDCFPIAGTATSGYTEQRNRVSMTSQNEPIVAITVLFPNERAVYLDELGSAIRRNTGKTLSRSALIRAMTKALTPLYGEWLRCSSEADIERMIKTRLVPPAAGSQQGQHGRKPV